MVFNNSNYTSQKSPPNSNYYFNLPADRLFIISGIAQQADYISDKLQLILCNFNYIPIKGLIVWFVQNDTQKTSLFNILILFTSFVFLITHQSLASAFVNSHWCDLI